jgi:hypothetical protein
MLEILKNSMSKLIEANKFKKFLGSCRDRTGDLTRVKGA